MLLNKGEGSERRRDEQGLEWNGHRLTVGHKRETEDEGRKGRETWKRDGNFSARIVLHSFDPDHPSSPSLLSSFSPI